MLETSQKHVEISIFEVLVVTDCPDIIQVIDISKNKW